jgi:hypothetical protein
MPRKENLLISKPTKSVAVPVCSTVQEENIQLTMQGQLVKVLKKHSKSLSEHYKIKIQASCIGTLQYILVLKIPH